MSKFIQIVFIAVTLLAILSQSWALKCYDCKIPNEECLNNYMSKTSDCDSSLVTQLGSFAGQTPICAKVQQGN